MRNNALHVPGLGAPAGPPPQDLFRADLRKYYRICFGTERPRLAQRARMWLTHFGFHCVAIYRFERFARRWAARWGRIAFPLAALACVLANLLELIHHVRIYADIGPGFYVGHAGMIFIGPTRIGRNFSLTHNVTIGFGHSERARGFPVIGDDVWVGTGSVLSGAIRVGDGATIANGTMLSRSVPPRTLCAGNPGRVVLQGYDNSGLLGMAVETPAEPPTPVPQALPCEESVDAPSALDPIAPGPQSPPDLPTGAVPAGAT
jgi:serine O-acetyltransferase